MDKYSFPVTERVIVKSFTTSCRDSGEIRVVGYSFLAAASVFIRSRIS